MLKINLLKYIIPIMLLIQTSLVGNCQKAPMKFGKIDLEDLKMTVYENDTTAEAVILCDYGIFLPDDIKFTRLCRIKILTKDGVRWANKRINSYSKVVLKARSYNLVNGEIEVTKMKNESVYEEYVENYLVGTRFSIPNVKVGSVIEFQYTIEGLPNEWRFQDIIPVKWSELRMQQNDYVKFQKSFFGFERLAIIENNRWIAENMPAFREEAFMSSYTNYITKFEFDIREIFVPGRYIKEFATSWEQINETLIEDHFVGKRLETNLYLNDDAKRINELGLPELVKATKAYELVKERLSWNESIRLQAYTPLNSVYNNKKNGSSSEINLILIALLEKLDIDVTPVILSTRDNGLLSPIYPSINKLNYVIAMVNIDNKTYYLDATDKLNPFGLLPKRCINGESRTFVEEFPQWISIKAPKKSKEIIYSNLNVLSDGEINGTISHKMLDYAAYDFRKDFEDFTTQDDFIQNKESNYAGMSINDYSFDNIYDIYKPVIAKYDISLQNNADIIGENIYINPMLFEKLDDNPFKMEERKYPVDYIHPIDKSYILSLSIPKGYVIDQLPTPFKAALPENKGSFIYTISNTGNRIQLTYKFNINNPIIFPEEYKMLKQFYDLIINKHSEMIIFKKINS